MLLRKICALAIVCGFFGAGVARADLYGDDKNITSGDLKDLDYWHAKFYHMMLQAAIKSRQPEYLVGLLARTQANQTMPGLIKKYPKHEELKKWLAEYEGVIKKVNDDANRVVEWKPDFTYWDNEAYRQLWVNMNLAKMHEDEKEWKDAYGRYQWAAENAKKMTDHEEWMKNWPEETVKWVKETKEKADDKTAEMKKKQ